MERARHAGQHGQNIYHLMHIKDLPGTVKRGDSRTQSLDSGEELIQCWGWEDTVEAVSVLFTEKDDPCAGVYKKMPEDLEDWGKKQWLALDEEDPEPRQYNVPQCMKNACKGGTLETKKFFFNEKRNTALAFETKTKIWLLVKANKNKVQVVFEQSIKKCYHRYYNFPWKVEAWEAKFKGDHENQLCCDIKVTPMSGFFSESKEGTDTNIDASQSSTECPGSPKSVPVPIGKRDVPDLDKLDTPGNESKSNGSSPPPLDYCVKDRSKSYPADKRRLRRLAEASDPRSLL